MLVVVRGLAVLADLNVLVGVEGVVAYLLMASFDNRLDYTDLDMNTSFYRFKISTGLILRRATRTGTTADGPWIRGAESVLMIWRIDHWVALCTWSH